MPIQVLDGDEVRESLSAGLGFSRADRDTNVRRIHYVAGLLARHGVLVLAAVISPYAETRAEIRRLSAAEGIPFLEVWVRADLSTVVARDVKGLYQRALAGELSNFTGVSDPYEPPLTAELELATDASTIDEAAGRLIALLVERGLVG